MSKVRCTSIKGLGVAASGPEINLNKFSHGQPLDLQNIGITASVLTLANCNFTTSTSTTMNATNVVAKGRGQMNFNGTELLIPTGTTAERPTTGLQFGSIRVNSELGQVEMYTNKQGTPQWEKLG
ncbi:sericin 1 precursor-like protein [Synechococcus phage ACG-2014b]|uniref:Sericin 1-like protein n=2 Tax=Synechococcus phage ACG-2014b TaxID=1493508 RepID=A0A0E3FZ06_9CAUD|nr:sericin 1 precursor-like protein [Synechococcus phage ACG-2014b]YP_009779662.1 sericin 1 precursor-like protein [Synechococcus phage ACG-2014b]YP_009779876.1 sericin 1 precursor-like protein [Synechococcus phage ACG-2014b]AIX17256.1 sericin 1 precursor-like protein [Synechococcus phage ACG-2014b]AIX17470.1 sericin 1 precursor-like protein [Synechococcus phage ACG-2014b]AIX17685.1 sericin 1 precursor-like protein [Synechococcus phage ACG-2014b]AIX17902.1 sericin 1 precursor-like protein [Sy